MGSHPYSQINALATILAVREAELAKENTGGVCYNIFTGGKIMTQEQIMQFFEQNKAALVAPVAMYFQQKAGEIFMRNVVEYGADVVTGNWMQSQLFPALVARGEDLASAEGIDGVIEIVMEEVKKMDPSGPIVEAISFAPGE